MLPIALPTIISSFIPKDERVPKFFLIKFHNIFSSFIPKDERVPKLEKTVLFLIVCSFIPKDERVPKLVDTLYENGLVPLYQKMREYQNNWIKKN